MKIDSCFQFGRIIRHHGIKGELSVSITSAAKHDLKKFSTIFIDLNEKLVPFSLQEITFTGAGKAIMKIEDIHNQEDALPLLQRNVYLPLTELPNLAKGQFYYHEIIGYQVWDVVLGELGTVKEIFEMPGQDVIEMQYRGNDVLIPIHNDIVLSSDPTTRRLQVSLPEGLVDIYLEPKDKDDGDED